MSSLALRTPALFFKSCFSASPPPSSSSSSCSLALASRRSNFLLNFPRKIACKERFVLRAQPFDSSSSGETGDMNDPNAADFKPTNGAFVLSFISLSVYLLHGYKENTHTLTHAHVFADNVIKLPINCGSLMRLSSVDFSDCFPISFY